MNFKSILKEQFKDLITEETLTAVHEAFEAAVKEKAKLQLEDYSVRLDEEHSEKLQSLVEAIDADHTAKMQKLVETIDFDHSQKFQKAITKLDEKHTGMLQQIVKKYQIILKEEVETYRTTLVEGVSNYIDLYLEKAIPADQINEAVENTKARKTLVAIRQLVSIDEEYIDNEVREALQDGKKTIDSLKRELNESVEANAKINNKLSKAEASLLIESKTKDLPTNAKAYVTKLLKGKSPEYIQENYQYVVEMFEREISEQEDSAREGIADRIVKSVDRPETDLLEEEISSYPQALEPAVGGYLNEMKRIDGSKLRR
jgi:predicted transcriptional regulator